MIFLACKAKDLSGLANWYDNPLKEIKTAYAEGKHASVLQNHELNEHSVLTLFNSEREVLWDKEI